MRAKAASFLAAGALSLALVATSAASPSPVRRDLDGVWTPVRPASAFRPADGEPIPFTPEGRARYLKNLADRKAGRREPQLDCTPPGVPRLMAEPNRVQILSEAKQISFFHEFEHNQRLIYLDEDHPSDLDATYLGHSVGRWDGSTLVVDTVALNDKTRIDAAVPHSDKLHVVERFRTLQGGKLLEDRITVEDPVVFTAPWTARRLYASTPGVRLDEMICEEKLFGGALARHGRAAQ